MLTITVGIRPDQHRWLGEMSGRHEVFVSEYIRQGIDMLMAAAKEPGTVMPSSP